MSQSKARLTAEGQSLRENRDELFRKLTRLMGYVYDLQQANPDMIFPELPDEYSEAMWRHAV